MISLAKYIDAPVLTAARHGLKDGDAVSINSGGMNFRARVLDGDRFQIDPPTKWQRFRDFLAGVKRRATEMLR